MKMQEIFNKAVTELRKQGAPARKILDSGRAQCFYKMDDGRRCAVGHLLTDEQIEELRQSDQLGSDLLELDDDFIESISPEDTEYPSSFLSGLQSMHDDTSSDFSDFEQNVYLFAGKWELEVPPK